MKYNLEANRLFIEIDDGNMKKTVSGMILTLLVLGTLTFSVSIRPVKASGTIYIRADGSVDPLTPSIQRNGDTYTVTSDIITDASTGIVVERNNTVLEGGGHMLQGKMVSNSNGIYVSGRSSITIRNISVESFHNGIYERGCSNNCITETNLFHDDYGIYFQSSKLNVITGNSIKENTYGGIWLELSQNNSISKNELANLIGSNGIGGIKLQDFSNYNDIVDNNLTSNTWYNIYIENSRSNRIFHNNLVNNTWQAYDDSSGNLWDDGYPSGGNYWSDYLGNDTFNGPYQNVTGSDGIGDSPYVIDASNRDNYPLMNPYPSGPVKLTVSSDHDSPNPSSGDHYYSNGSSVTCSVTSPVTEGMTVWTCSGWSGNGSVPSCPGAYTSVTFTITQDSSITWKWYAWNLVYIRPDGSIDPPTAPIQRDGDVYSLNDFLIWGWTIYIERNNTVFNGGGCYLTGPSYWGSAIILQNVVNVTVINTNFQGGNCGIYLENCSNCNITHNFCWQNMEFFIYLFNSSSNTIEYNNIGLSSSVFGIYMSQSSNNVVQFNDDLAYDYGIYLAGSANNVIDSNIISARSLAGVTFLGSDFNNVSHNTIGPCGYYGIRSWGAWNNSVCQNTFTGCEIALADEGGHNNAVLGNNFTGNHFGVLFYGAPPYDPSYDMFCHNLFNNAVQVSAYGDPGNSTWDDGYPSGGNYWSDYNGTDIYHGPYQNETGCDGIGDSPYVIDANNIDNYPLMKPYAGSHDVGTIGVNLSKTVVGQGLSMNLSVIVLNYGEQTETFNVSIEANSTALKTQTVTLEPRTSEMLNYTCGTEGLAKGNYTLNVYAEPVPGETEIADNNFIDGRITVSIMGDIAGRYGPDGKVDVRDIAQIARLYGAKYTDPRYDPNCDLTGPTFGVPDGKIDSRDLSLVASRFGQKNP